MNFYVMTLFPDYILQGVSESITGRAVRNGIIRVEAFNIRDYTNEKHGHVDDYPYGGGAGMLMQAQPVYDCYQAVLRSIRENRTNFESPVNQESPLNQESPVNQESPLNQESPVNQENPANHENPVNQENPANHENPENHESPANHENLEKQDCRTESVPRVIHLTPQGRRFDQTYAQELAKEENLVFLCGHYEGIDERALELIGPEEASLGDFVLTGGELPALVMIDCISRLVPGVLGKAESAVEESFSDGLLEYPQYTRPEEYMGLKVPEILLSGHHANVEKWRREQAIERTRLKRPDLYYAYMNTFSQGSES